MKLRTLMLLCSWALGLSAGNGWAPIPPDVWAIKSGPKGALVLESRLKVQLHELEAVYRVRIFSEEGMGAADLVDLPKTIRDIQGRTVYPDGREVRFDKQKDFAERVLTVGSMEHRQLHLIPPGVNGDCVVEVQWRERSDGHLGVLPKRWVDGRYAQWRMGGTHPTLLAQVELAKYLPFVVSVQGATGPGVPWSSERSETRDLQIFKFRNLPPFESVPYALSHLQGQPRVTIYWQPDRLIRAAHEGPDEYWSQAFEIIYIKDYEEEIKKGSAFRGVVGKLLEGLPADTGERAATLLGRLDERLKNLSSASVVEATALPTGFWKDYEVKRLEDAAETGLVSGSGMRLFYYHLLKAAGIQPLIGKVVSREAGVFRYRDLNVWQFDQDLIGVNLGAEKGILWLDPSARHAKPGLLHPNYQGTAILMFSTEDGKTWKPSVGRTPISPAEANTQVFDVKLTLDEATDAFSIKAQFRGYPEFVERQRFRSSDAPEQERLLKERLEKSSKSLRITQTSIQNAMNPSNPISWEARGTLAREVGRRRMVQPFPGMPLPLWIPDVLDVTRTDTIVVPYLFEHAAESSFVVPDGYEYVPQEGLREQNGIGTVQWIPTYDPVTRKVAVRFSVEVSHREIHSQHWDAFKAWLGWIDTAARTVVVLSKGGS